MDAETISSIQPEIAKQYGSALSSEVEFTFWLIHLIRQLLMILHLLDKEIHLIVCDPIMSNTLDHYYKQEESFK